MIFIFLLCIVMNIVWIAQNANCAKLQKMASRRIETSGWE